MSSSVLIGGRRKQNRLLRSTSANDIPMFIPGRAQQTGDSSSAMRCWSCFRWKTHWEPGARLPHQRSFGNAGRVGNPVRALSAFWYDRQTTILRACRFPPRSIDHQSGFHGICGFTCLATVNRHGHSPSHRVTVDQFTLPRYLSSHASTARDRSGRSWLTSCGVSSTMWRLSAGGVPSIRNIGS